MISANPFKLYFTKDEITSSALPSSSLSIGETLIDDPSQLKGGGDPTKPQKVFGDRNRQVAMVTTAPPRKGTTSLSELNQSEYISATLLYAFLRAINSAHGSTLKLRYPNNIRMLVGKQLTDFLNSCRTKFRKGFLAPILVGQRQNHFVLLHGFCIEGEWTVHIYDSLPKFTNGETA